MVFRGFNDETIPLIDFFSLISQLLGIFRPRYFHAVFILRALRVAAFLIASLALGGSVGSTSNHASPAPLGTACR